MYLNLETQDSAGPSNNNIIFIDGKPIPRFLIKILFFINDDGTFVNRNFIMANTTNAASKEFFDCETTLLQIEDYFPTMRFLTKKTRTADVFINMNEQNSLEIPKREVNIQTFGDTAAVSLKIILSFLYLFFISRILTRFMMNSSKTNPSKHDNPTDSPPRRTHLREISCVVFQLFWISIKNRIIKLT